MGFLKRQYDAVNGFTDRHKKTVYALVGLGAAAAVAIYSEQTGYNLYDLPNGWNPVCAVDPTCRKLTEDEITWAREFFGDTINYGDVNYFSRQMLGRDRDALAYHIYGNIYEARNWDERVAESPRAIANVFIHEMAHVWQYETGIIPVLRSEKTEHDQTYAFDINEYDTFAEYGIEQQASILQRIAATRYRFNSLEGGDKSPLTLSALFMQCVALNVYEEKAAQMLPLEFTDCEARFGQEALPTPEV